MSPADSVLKRLALALPDIPRWLETRSMLLSGLCELLGLEERPELSFVARDPQMCAVMIVGRPAVGAIQEAASRNQGRGGLVCQSEAEAHVAAALPGWRPELAVLHLLADAACLPPVPPGAVQYLSNMDVARLPGVPPELKSELEIATLRTAIAATVVDGKPVSFCYPASVTETLWDVSIDTLEPYRRRGYAGLCVSFMVDEMHRQEKRPVWGAVESNIPSLRLASRLGFRPVDRVLVFSPTSRPS